MEFMKLEPNGVELWAQEFEKSKKAMFSKDESKDFIKACFLANQLDEDKKLIEMLNNNHTQCFATVFWLRVKHAKYVTYEITPTVAILAEFFIKNFGMSTMLVAYMQYVAHKKNIKKFTHEEFCQYVLPFGAPTEEEWSRLWQLQKLNPKDIEKNELMIDNGLDYALTYQSLNDNKESK